MPFISKFDNIIEIANESTLLIVFYFMIPYVVDNDVQFMTKYNLGFFVITIIMANILLNFLLFFSNIIANLCAKCKPSIIRMIMFSPNKIQKVPFKVFGKFLGKHPSEL